jgi:starch synthase (maltosyl-transferring)
MRAKAKDYGIRRTVIEGVTPEVDGGRFPVKRVEGEAVVVEADVFVDGHDALACALRWRREEDAGWHSAPMRPLVNDRWRGEFRVGRVGRYRYTLDAWVDHFATWRRDLIKRIDAGQELAVPLQMGVDLVEQAAGRAHGAEAAALADYDRELEVVADRILARFAAWYEMFPRSQGTIPGGTEPSAPASSACPPLPAMGFDVLYLPPIHPIGVTFRKGQEQQLDRRPRRSRLPMGHRRRARAGTRPWSPCSERSTTSALSCAPRGRPGWRWRWTIALQCSPDHPYVTEHPEWFYARPDGTIKYAENPPKKYQDIYPLNFECRDWRGALGGAARSVFLFWIETTG